MIINPSSFENNFTQKALRLHCTTNPGLEDRTATGLWRYREVRIIEFAGIFPGVFALQKRTQKNKPRGRLRDIATVSPPRCP